MIRRAVRRRKAGFTLAELLVALVVICLLSTCVFLITRSAAGTFTRGEDVISANDLKSIALEYVRQELRTASAIMLTDDLEADGGASSVNMATLTTERWKREGDRLILEGKSIGNGQTIEYRDEWTVLEAGEVLRLRSADGAERVLERAK